MSNKKTVCADILSAEQRNDLLQIAQQYGAFHIRIFGSRSRGEARPDSDLDMLVEMEETRSLLDLIGFRNAAEDLLSIKIDVVTEAGLPPQIKEQVLADAIDL